MIRKTHLKMRAAASALAAVSLVLTSSACGSSSLSASSSGTKDSIKVGLYAPLSGVYASYGEEMKNAFDLYLEQHQGKISGRDVEVAVFDEGATPQTAVASAQQALLVDSVDVLTGVVSSASALAVRPLIEQTQTPTLVSVAGASALTGSLGSDYLWRVGYENPQPGYALGKYLAAQPGQKEKKFFITAPNYAGGVETVEGFRQGFTEGGGQVVGSQLTVLGETTNFQPTLAAAEQAGANAVFSFFAGSEAVGFIQQYKSFNYESKFELYGSGELTSPQVLEAVGGDAKGIRTSANYSPSLDTPANKAFVDAYEKKFSKRPSGASMAQYDAMLVLEQVLASSSQAGKAEIVEGLKALKEITESPRGAWSFDGIHKDPKQNFYLLNVVEQDGHFATQVEADLGAVGYVNVGS